MTKTKRVYVEMINVNELNPAGFQPKGRTDLRVIRDLIKSMSVDGFWTHKPITITEDNCIADGHRRWTAAKTLGINKVPCLRTNQDLETAWVASNSTARRVNGKEWVQAVSSGLTKVSKLGMGRNILYYQDKYGEDVIDFLATNGMSTGPIPFAERLCKYLGWDVEQNVFKVLRWMVKHEMVRKSRFALEEKMSKDVLSNSILNDQPLQFVTDALTSNENS